jgi:hypothetical protein
MLNSKEKLLNSKISTSSSNKKNFNKNNEENLYKNLFKCFNKNNNDLTSVLNSSKYEDESETDYSEQLKPNIGFPFCQYHRYNIKLPKKYTCNFKNCCCCGFHDAKAKQTLDNDNNNDYINKKHYVYNIKSNKKNRSLLDPFFKKKKNKKKKDDSSNKNKIVSNSTDKNININNNTITKTIISDTSESNQISDFSFHFLKPNNENIKLPKNDFIIENGAKSPDDSCTIDSGLELPSDCNINDGKDLRKYRNLVNNIDQKSRIHLSVLYYKKLNKSYNQVYSRDIKENNKLKGVNKDKSIELLRE